MATKSKILWKGIFNYQYQMTILYRAAYTKPQAKEIMCRALAAKHDVSIQTVRSYFDGSKDNYSIEIETEYKEAE
jgi:ATP-dependent helicase YprA (DUF1998 family)